MTFVYKTKLIRIGKEIINSFTETDPNFRLVCQNMPIDKQFPTNPYEEAFKRVINYWNGMAEKHGIYQYEFVQFKRGFND
jgi:hypothetical protein